MAGEPSFSGRWSVMTGANPTFSGSSVRHAYVSDTIKAQQAMLRSQATRGTRAQVVSQTRRGVINVGGDLMANASPLLLGFHLVQAMGGGSATAPAFADLLPEWAIMIDRGTGGHALGDCYKYLGLKTRQLQISGRAAGLVDLTVGVVGKTETAGQTFVGAALDTTLAAEPYSACDMSLAIDPLGVDAAPKVIDWNLTINNNAAARFTNSCTADDVMEGERLVTFTANAVLQSQLLSDLYDTVGKNGLPATLTLSNSTVSTVFSFAALQFNKETLNIQGNEFILPLRCEIRGTTGVEMTVANDQTP